MAQSPIATAADYADAMMSARRAKNWLFFLLLAVSLSQLALFFVARYTHVLRDGSEAPVASHVAVVSEVTPATLPTSGPAESIAGTIVVSPPTASAPLANSQRGVEAIRYLVAVSDFAGIVLVIVLSLVLLLIVAIMLVGRLIGVSKVVSAYIWCLLLGVLYFPWQAFLSTADFKVPGVLFTWSELNNPVLGANFQGDGDIKLLILRWSRFVVFPIIGLMILLCVQAKSSRGLRMALGEADFESGSDRPIT